MAEVQLLQSVDSWSQDEASSVLTRARAGDPEAFQTIFRRYGKPILSFIYNLVGERGRAEELMQETFIRAYRKLGTIRKDRQLSTWLFGIARNVVRESIREKYSHARERIAGSISETLEDGHILPDERLITGELRQAIQRALASLCEDYRLIFVLKILHKVSYQEAAQITGSSVSKLKTDLHRARLEMKQKLRTYWGEAGLKL